MNVRYLFCSLFALIILCHSGAEAQILGPYGTSPLVFGVDANAILTDTGTYGTGTLSLSGAGTRLVWYPGKAAFRAGNVSGTDWNDANIGNYSVGLGQDVLGSGFASVVFGYQSTSSGSVSAAIGYQAVASGPDATSIGCITTASGNSSIALGYATAASGGVSTALGDETSASGANSTSMGYSTSATGNASTAMGSECLASGEYSLVAGYCAYSTSYESVVLGQFNIGGGSATSWVATDPIFEIGNGTSTAPADALVVYKNGNAQVQGTLRCSPGGDLSMGSFTAGTAP